MPSRHKSTVIFPCKSVSDLKKNPRDGRFPILLVFWDRLVFSWFSGQIIWYVLESRWQWLSSWENQGLLSSTITSARPPPSTIRGKPWEEKPKRFSCRFTQNQVANSANGTNLEVLKFNKFLKQLSSIQILSKIVSWSEKIKKPPQKLKKPAQRVETQLTPFMGHLDSRNSYLLLKEEIYPKINTTGLRSETMAADVHHLPRSFQPKEFASQNHNNSGSNTKAESKSLPESIDPN